MKAVIAALFGLFLILPVGAGTLAGVTLSDRTKVGNIPLVLNGMGLRKKLFIRVYVGGLYLTQKEKSAAKVLGTDSPRRMVLSFIYNVDKEQMCDAWMEGLEDNTPNAQGEVAGNFRTLCTWMDGVEKGQQIVLTYIPGEGTHVEVAGQAKGILSGKATADAILSTWIGPNPGPGDDFKKAVLGG